VWLANNATNLSVGYSGGAPTFFVDNTNARTGIRTSTIPQELVVAGDGNITGDLFLSGSLLYNGSAMEGSNIGNVSGEGTRDKLPLWTAASDLTDSIITQSIELLTIIGSMNISLMIQTNGNHTYENPSNANTTKEVWTDSNGKVVVERYWNGSALLVNVTG